MVFSKRGVRELKQLAAKKDIIVCKPDKGRGVVIIDKDAYVSRMFALISDASIFENLSLPIIKYTLKIEDRANNFLRKLKEEGIMPADIYNSLFSSGSAPGILYGLPKIHKVDFPSKFQFR